MSDNSPKQSPKQGPAAVSNENENSMKLSDPTTSFDTPDGEDDIQLLGGLRRKQDQRVQQSEYVRRANRLFQDRISDIFKQFDTDGSGTIDREELKDVLDSMGYSLNEQQLEALLAQVDVDGNGSLDLEEFTVLVNLWRDAAGYKIFDDGQSTAVQHITQSTSKRTTLVVSDAPWRWYWDTAFMLIAIYFFLAVVLVWNWSDEQETLDRIQVGLIAPDIIFSIFLFVEMGLKVNTATWINNRLVNDRKHIFLHYVYTGWFFIDLLGALPMRLFATDDTAQNVLNHFRLLLLLRLPTLWPTSHLTTITSKYVKYQYGVLPWLTGAMAFMCGVSALTVIHQAFVRDAVEKGLTDEKEAKFASVLYWTMYVVAGVGYGDMTPQTDAHRWFAGILFIISMIVNGLFVGSMVSLMQEADVEMSRQSSLVLMKAVLEFFHVPESLQEEILQFQNHILQRDIAASYSGIVDMLPGQMRRNILMQSHVPLLQGVNIFRSAHASTIVQIAEQLTSIFAPPECYIAVAGDRSKELVVLNYGFVDVLSIGKYVTTLKRGDFFGEMGVLDKENMVFHRFSFKALTYCDLFLLPVGRLAALELRFPKFSKDLGEELKLTRGQPDRFDKLAEDAVVLSGTVAASDVDMAPLPLKSGTQQIITQNEGLLARHDSELHRNDDFVSSGLDSRPNSHAGGLARPGSRREAFGRSGHSPPQEGLFASSVEDPGNSTTLLTVPSANALGGGRSPRAPSLGNGGQGLLMSITELDSDTYDQSEAAELEDIVTELEEAIAKEVEAIIALESELANAFSIPADKLGLPTAAEKAQFAQEDKKKSNHSSRSPSKQKSALKRKPTNNANRSTAGNLLAAANSEAVTEDFRDNSLEDIIPVGGNDVGSFQPAEGPTPLRSGGPTSSTTLMMSDSSPNPEEPAVSDPVTAFNAGEE